MIADSLDLTGRTALITGGAGLLAEVWTEAVLACGGAVVLADIRSVPGERLARLSDLHAGRVRAEVVDITNEAELEGLSDRLAAASVTIDVLINNAARNPAVGANGLDAAGRFESLAWSEWESDLAVGLGGAFLCARLFGAQMAARGAGVVINVSSDLGLVGPDQRLYEQDGLDPSQQPVKPVTYSVVKTGLIGLTRYLATYWAHCGVRVNTLCLGGVQAGQDPEFLDRVAYRIPMGRLANRREYGAAMAFLCSNASSYMTGACMVLDGGRTVW